MIAFHVRTSALMFGVLAAMSIEQYASGDGPG
jgi:hypothetical protein